MPNLEVVTVGQIKIFKQNLDNFLALDCMDLCVFVFSSEDYPFFLRVFPGRSVIFIMMFPLLKKKCAEKSFEEIWPEFQEKFIEEHSAFKQTLQILSESCCVLLLPKEEVQHPFLNLSNNSSRYEIQTDDMFL